MRLCRWWGSLGFFWQVYLLMAVSFGCIITLVEGVLEPLAISLLQDFAANYPEWNELVLWVIGTLAPTLLIGCILTGMVMRKLADLDQATRRLASGELKARIPEVGDEKDVFNRLAINFNTMADSLERLIANEKRLLADISHELRSPLTRMNVATALLPKKRNDDDGFESLVRNLESEIDQMNTLVGALLEQGRARIMEQGGRTRIDLSRLTEEIVDGYRSVGQENGVEIAARIEPGLTILGNPVRARMILENILGNAVFYAPAASSVDVCVAGDGKTVHLSVRDYGPGVPEEHLGDIFRAFFRADDSRARNSGGVGLGLTLARDAALAMGGDIKAENAGPGLGIVVVFPSVEGRGGGVASKGGA